MTDHDSTATDRFDIATIAEHYQGQDSLLLSLRSDCGSAGSLVPDRSFSPAPWASLASRARPGR
jgi:hypothetical protein